MKTSVIIPIYNNVELCSKSIESVLEKTGGDFEVILVDNHSLDNRSREYIANIKNDKVIIVDKEKNLGCHEAINAGIEVATGDYYVKLDDDTFIVTQDWNLKLIDILNENDNIAYIAPNCNVRHNYPYEEIGDFQSVPGGTVGFSCVMIPKTTYELFGPLKSRVWQTNEVQNESLYGGEELYYAQLAQRHVMKYGYAKDVYCEHMGNEFRDILYVVWKWGYGYRGSTKKDLADFRNDNMAIWSVCQDWLNTDNGWYKEKANEIMKKISETGKAY